MTSSHHVKQLGLNDREFQYQQGLLSVGMYFASTLKPSIEAPDCLTGAFSPNEKYIETIQALTDEVRSDGTIWLSAIVGAVEDKLESLHE